MPLSINDSLKLTPDFVHCRNRNTGTCLASRRDWQKLVFVCRLIPHQRAASLAKCGHSLLISTVCLASQTTLLLSSAHTADADLPPPLVTKCAMQTVERIPRRNLKQYSTPHMRIKQTWRKLRYHLTWYQDNLPMQCCGRTFGNQELRNMYVKRFRHLGTTSYACRAAIRSRFRTHQAGKHYHDTLVTYICTPEESQWDHRNRGMVNIESTGKCDAKIQLGV